MERVRTDIAAPLTNELLAERRRREAAESSTTAARAEQKDSANRLRETEEALLEARRTVEAARSAAIARIRRNVSWLKRGIAALIGLACLAGVWLSLPSSVGGSPSTLGIGWRWLARAAVVIAVIITVYGAWFGGSVRSFVRFLEVWLSRRIETRMLRKSRLSSAEMGTDRSH
jgi:hypothetical protein